MTTRGGVRQGAGRKKREPTITKRIPESLVDQFNVWLHSYRKLAEHPLPEDAQYILFDAPILAIPISNDSVQAGMPTAASADIAQYLDFNELLAPNPSETIVIPAKGESMIDAGIGDGDMLVVNRSFEPKHGDIVVAKVDDEFTVKRYITNSIGFILRAENSTGKYPNIIPKAGSMVYFIGVVKHIIKAV